MLAPRRSLSRCSGVSLHSEDHQVIPSRNSRDDKLWGLLPSRDSPYEYGSLSRAETDAFVESLADGFGEVWIRDNQPLPLPTKAKEKSGLLEHYFFSDHARDTTQKSGMTLFGICLMAMMLRLHMRTFHWDLIKGDYGSIFTTNSSVSASSRLASTSVIGRSKFVKTRTGRHLIIRKI